MGLRAVARKELRDAVRSRALHALVALFVLFGGGLAAIHWVPETVSHGSVDRDTVAVLNSVRQATVLLVPMVGLGLGYNAVVGERESGTLRVLLGLPNTRRDAVFGKLLGRSAVAALAVLAGCVAVGGIGAATYDTFDLVAFVAYTLLTVGYAAVYVAVGVGFSTWADSRPVALGGAALLYGVFLLGWDLVMLAVQVATIGYRPETGLPEWLQALTLLNPANAYEIAARAAVPEFRVVTTLPAPSGALTRDWLGFAVLAGWLVVPVALGYWRFERADLG